MATTQNLAAILYRKGEDEASLALFSKTLHQLEKLHGYESIELEPCLSWIGMLKFEQGDHSSAEKFSRRSVQIHSRHFGENHQEVLDPFERLIDILEASGKEDEANSKHQQLLGIVEVAYGIKSVETAVQLNSYALFLERIDRRKDAAKQYGKAISVIIERATDTAASEDTLDELIYNLGDCLMQLGEDRDNTQEILLSMGIERETFMDTLDYVFGDEQEE